MQGKAASHYLRNRPGFKLEAAYNFWTAYLICADGMQKPSQDVEKVKGTWGCNGSFFWGALSNGKDRKGRTGQCRVVPEFEGRDVTGIAGSRHLYAFRQVFVGLCVCMCVCITHRLNLPCFDFD